MDSFKQNLFNLGLSEEEVIVYLSALEHGSATALELARNTGIPRTTVYLLIDSLLGKQLLSHSSDEKKKSYFPASPDELVKMAQHKKEKMQETLHSMRADLPQLHALYHLYHAKPKVNYYNGKSEIIKLFEESLKEERIYIYQLSQDFTSYFGPYLNTYREEVKKKMRYTKEILAETVDNLQYKKSNDSVRNQIKLLSQKDVINIDSLLYGDKNIILTYKEGQPHATVICDKDIVFFEVLKFNALWNECEMYQSK